MSKKLYELLSEEEDDSEKDNDSDTSDAEPENDSLEDESNEDSSNSEDPIDSDINSEPNDDSSTQNFREERYRERRNNSGSRDNSNNRDNRDRGKDRGDNKKNGKKGWIALQRPVDIKRLILYRYKGTREVKLVANFDKDKGRYMGLPRDSSYKNNHDLFKYGMPNVQRPDMKFSYKEKKLEVVIRRRQLFAIMPVDPKDGVDDPLSYRVFTPFTGLNFAFIVPDKSNVLFTKIGGEYFRRESKTPTGDFSSLLENSDVVGLRFGSKILFNKTYFNLFINRYDAILRQFIKDQEERAEKLKKFRFRTGDVIKNLDGHEENLIILHQIINRKANKFYFVLLPEVHMNAAVIDDHLLVREAPYSLDPLKDSSSTPTSLARSLKEEDMKPLLVKSKPKLDKFISMLGLSQEDILPYFKRKEDDVLPIDNRSEKRSNDLLKPGVLIHFEKDIPSFFAETYLATAPTKIIEDKKPTSDFRFANRFSTSPFTTVTPTKVVEDRRKYRFENSSGWYILTYRKPIDKTDKVRWALVPEPRRNITMHIPRFVSSDKEGNEVYNSERKEVSYLSFDIPRAYEFDLINAITVGKIQNIEKQPRFEAAKEFYNKYDPTGREKAFNSGEVIRYKGRAYFILNRKTKGDVIEWLLLPLAAIVNMNSDEMSAGKILKPGGNKTLGMRTVRTGNKNNKLEDVAERMFTLENTENLGLVKLAIEYYSLYDENGIPREKQLNNSQMLKNFNTEIGDRKDEIGISPRLVSPEEAIRSDNTNLAPQKIPNSTQITTKPATSVPKSTKIDEELDRLKIDETDLTVPKKVEILIREGKLKNGMLIDYMWDSDTTTQEIFLQYDVLNQRMKLAVHRDFPGNYTGWTSVFGFEGITLNGNISPGTNFASNLENKAYENGYLSRTFKFDIDYMEKNQDIINDNQELIGSNNTNQETMVTENEEKKLDFSLMPSLTNSPVTVSPDEQEEVANRAIEIKDDIDIGKVVSYLDSNGEEKKGIVEDVFITDNNTSISEASSWYVNIYKDVSSSYSVDSVPVGKIVEVLSLDPNTLARIFPPEEGLERYLEEGLFYKLFQEISKGDRDINRIQSMYINYKGSNIKVNSPIQKVNKFYSTLLGNNYKPFKTTDEVMDEENDLDDDVF